LLDTMQAEVEAALNQAIEKRTSIGMVNWKEIKSSCSFRMLIVDASLPAFDPYQDRCTIKKAKCQHTVAMIPDIMQVCICSLIFKMARPKPWEVSPM
jgi:monomeric isocitrate dehydrogenase